MTAAATENPMKVLVTGCHGILGSAFVELLKKRGIRYVPYDRAHPQVIDHDITAVVHFGGLTPHSVIKKGLPSVKDYRDANVAATATLLKALSSAKKLMRFVNIGSASEYGFAPRPLREDARCNPGNAYGESKLAQSALVEAFARAHNVKTFHLRIFNITGLPDRDAEGPSFNRPHLFATLASQFKKKSPRMIQVTSAKDMRDFVALEDVLEAIFAALTSNVGGVYEVVNICSGRGTTISDVVNSFGKALHLPYTLRSSSRKSHRSVGVAKKAQHLLGWRARTSLEKAIREYIGERNRIVIVGAGVGGRMVLAEMEKEEHSDIVVVGFVDDDIRKKNKKLLGIPVLGTLAELSEVVRRNGISQVLISTPSAGKDVVMRVTEALPPGFSIKILPSVSSVILGNVDLSYVRDIDPSDLIGRPLIKSNQQLISRHVRGKTFLVTGGAGSIGSELVRQLADSGAKEIVVFDSWEEGVFNIIEESTSWAGSTKITARIGNIRDRERLAKVFGEFRFDTVLHAAAYKHVPLMESSPEEAKKTNVLGTRNVLDSVISRRVKNFILISTDKAVRPLSVMGRTKREAELLVKRYAKKYSRSRFSAVRFGNVLNSSGSAIPKFLKQIRSRQPVTVTHREMTRYFMSIPEAVSLVLTSWIIARNGQILLLDMGEPTKIMDLAERLIRIHGLRPHIDIPIIETGIRPGEKIHEELFHDPGKLKPSAAPRIFIAEEL